MVSEWAASLPAQAALKSGLKTALAKRVAISILPAL
jgi:hypothetical protein